MKKSISELIKEALLQRGHRSIRIDDTNFFLSLIGRKGGGGKALPEEGSGKRIICFGAFVVSVFAVLTFIIYAAVFFIKDILLFDEKPIVTEAGAIIPQRSCNREQVLFHFNSADLWARTGVQLQKGDRIRISHSGGFHSDVADIYLHARLNNRLNYPYYTSFGELRTDGVENCLYNRINDLPWWHMFVPWRWAEAEQRIPGFGSILWQTADENNVHNAAPENIHQIGPLDATRFFRIRKDGELFLTVNDILLTDAVIDNLNQGKKALWNEVDDSLRNNPSWARSNGLEFLGIHGEEGDSLLYEPSDIRTYLAVHPEMRGIWFQDNIGSVLVCVEIERKTSPMHWFIRWYRYTERCMNRACDDQPLLLKIFFGFCVFIWSVFCLILSLVRFCVAVLCTFWPLSVPGLIWLAVWLFRRWKRQRKSRSGSDRPLKNPRWKTPVFRFRHM